MSKKRKIILITEILLIILIAGVIVWYILLSNQKMNNINNENKENSERQEDNNNNEDNEDIIINPDKDEKDTRIYPLKMKFYKNNYDVCYENVDGNCVRVYYNSDGYQEEIYNNLDESNLVAEYICKTFDCVKKNIDYDKNLALIEDGKIYIFDFNSKNVVNTELDNIMDKNKIDGINIINNLGNNNYDLEVYSTEDKGNIYNIRDKKFLFDNWYDNTITCEIESLDEYFLVKNKEKNQWYIVTRDNEILKILDGNVYHGKTYANKLILTYYNGTDRYKNFFVLYKENLDKKVNLQGNWDINVIDNYIISSEYPKYPEYQKVYIYDGNTLNLIKTVTNALKLKQIKIASKIFYIATVDIGRGGNNTTTQVLDSNFDVLIGEHNLPSDYKKYDEGYFTPYFNDTNNTIATWFGKIYVYDLKGNLIRTINRDIIGLDSNYYVANENNNITLRDYNDNLITTFTTINDNLKVDNIGLGDYLANIEYNKDKSIFNVVIKDINNNKCKMYSYSFSNKVVTETNTKCGFE